MPSTPKWPTILKYILAGVLGAWTYIYTWASSVPGNATPWYVLAIRSFRFSVPVGAAALIVVLDIYKEFRYHSSQILLKKFLDHLHQKYFPYPTGGSHPEFRVTLFTPGLLSRKSLGVKARSGGLHRKAGVRWSIKRSEAEEYHGIAGYAWATGIFVAIDSLPDYDRCSPAEQLRYRRQTFVGESDVEKLHWKGRSYRCLVVKNQRGEKVGVLMMESKLPDGLQGITATALSSEAEYLQFLLG